MPNVNILDWTDNSTDETDFRVERKAEACALNNLAFSEIAQVGANVTTYTDQNVTPGQTYCYRVRAGNAAGFSAYTNTADRTVPGPFDEDLWQRPPLQAAVMAPLASLNAVSADPDFVPLIPAIPQAPARSQIRVRVRSW